jgi:hypothetical protein
MAGAVARAEVSDNLKPELLIFQLVNVVTSPITRYIYSPRCRNFLVFIFSLMNDFKMFCFAWFWLIFRLQSLEFTS